MKVNKNGKKKSQSFFNKLYKICHGPIYIMEMKDI